MALSEDDGKALLKTFATMGVKPPGDCDDNLEQWMFSHLKSNGKLNQGILHPLKVSLFSGEVVKGKVSFDLW